MNKEMVRLVIYIVSFLILISGLFVTADYFSLFGTKLDVRLDFSEVRFRTLDADTGGVVMRVGARCTQKHIGNACTRRESHQVGVVSVHIPVQRVIKRTILFKKEEEIVKTLDPKIHIMLIHQNYSNPIKTLLMEDIYSNRVTEYVIKMSPIKWEEQEEEGATNE
jgi:hypothetical protein